MSFQPPNRPTITPRIFTKDVPGLVAFLRAVFGADGETRTEVPVEMRIGDSTILVSDGGGVREPHAAFLYVYVQDADATYHRALEAGARSLETPEDMPWGDRRATVEDRWGNVWQIATWCEGAVP